MGRRIHENFALCVVLAIVAPAIGACASYGAHARAMPMAVATLGAILTLTKHLFQNPSAVRFVRAAGVLLSAVHGVQVNDGTEVRGLGDWLLHTNQRQLKGGL